MHERLSSENEKQSAESNVLELRADLTSMKDQVVRLTSELEEERNLATESHTRLDQQLHK